MGEDLGLDGDRTGSLEGRATDDDRGWLGKELQPTWALLLRDRAL